MVPCESMNVNWGNCVTDRTKWYTFIPACLRVCGLMVVAVHLFGVSINGSTSPRWVGVRIREIASYAKMSHDGRTVLCTGMNESRHSHAPSINANVLKHLRHIDTALGGDMRIFVSWPPNFLSQYDSRTDSFLNGLFR